MRCMIMVMNVIMSMTVMVLYNCFDSIRSNSPFPSKRFLSSVLLVDPFHGHTWTHSLNALNSASHIPFWTSWYDLPTHCPYANDWLDQLEFYSSMTVLCVHRSPHFTSPRHTSLLWERSERHTWEAHDFEALANVLSGVRSLNVVFADIVLFCRTV